MFNLCFCQGSNYLRDIQIYRIFLPKSTVLNLWSYRKLVSDGRLAKSSSYNWGSEICFLCTLFLQKKSLCRQPRPRHTVRPCVPIFLSPKGTRQPNQGHCISGNCLKFSSYSDLAKWYIDFSTFPSTGTLGFCSSLPSYILKPSWLGRTDSVLKAVQRSVHGWAL